MSANPSCEHPADKPLGAFLDKVAITVGEFDRSLIVVRGPGSVYAGDRFRSEVPEDQAALGYLKGEETETLALSGKLHLSISRSDRPSFSVCLMAGDESDQEPRTIHRFDNPVCRNWQIELVGERGDPAPHWKVSWTTPKRGTDDHHLHEQILSFSGELVDTDGD